MRYFFQTLLITLLISSSSFGQDNQDSTKKKKYVQLSGFTIDDETFEPIPYIYIYDKNLRKGALSDAYGFFSIVVGTGDTILFKSITYKQTSFVIPDSIVDVHMTHFQSLISEVKELAEAVVTPYGTKEQLAYAMIYEDIPDDDLRRAQRNLDPELMRQKGLTLTDANLNYKWAMQEHINQAYYAGQLPPNGLLNPIAWISFFKMLKQGKLNIQP